MKTRSCFVSNSSSSSFVVVCDADVYNRVLKEQHPFIRAVIEGSWNQYRGEINDKPLVVFGYYSDAGGYSTFDSVDYDGPDWDPQIKWSEKNDPFEAFNFFVSQLPEGSYITTSIGDGG